MIPGDKLDRSNLRTLVVTGMNPIPLVPAQLTALLAAADALDATREARQHAAAWIESHERTWDAGQRAAAYATLNFLCAALNPDPEAKK